MTVTSYTPPPQRDLPATIYTTAGWISGTFMVPKLRHFNDYLNHPHPFFKLKTVRLPGLDKDIPFFVLQKTSIIFIIPEPGDEALVSPIGGEKIEREVSCAFANGVISGTLDILKGVRVSDFLMAKAGLFVLRNCSAFLRTPAGSDVRHNIAHLMANSERIIGVSEPRFI